jgi:hypothetical protein
VFNWRSQSENPSRLVNPWDMLQLRARSFLQATDMLTQLSIATHDPKVTWFDNAALVNVKDAVDSLVIQLSELGLPLSVVAARKVRAFLDTSQSVAELKFSLLELRSRIHDEIEAQVVLALDPKRREFWESGNPAFGQDVFDHFPSAIDDVIEAGNCLALDRYTASVFHLLRIMEAGLRVLGKELGIPYAPSWESYLRQISTLVESDWKSKTISERARQPLYKELAGDLQSIKIAWRNPTMHIVKKYVADEAMQIYICVKQFMMRLARAGFSE